MRKLFKIRLPWCRAAHLAAATLIILTPAATDVHAQVLYGSIVGNITDPQGAALPGATVTATNTQTNQTRDVATSGDGTYSLPNLQPGQYNVKVQMPSFREFVRTNVPVTAGDISRVDASLQVGGITEAVTVESPSQLLQTDKADVHTELKSAEITAMPLNQYRNYQALVNLVPGATPAQFQNAETDTPQRSLRTNVNGQNPNTNSTRTDGATNVNLWLPHHNMYVSPAETVDSVNISTNNFDAEQGMAGGAAITVVTKSGTNSLRGSAFEFYNGDKLNATPYYFGTGDKPDKLPIKRNIFGGTAGGPIVKDKLFFFASFEAFKESRNVFQFFDVPDERLRNGDFSQAINSNGSMQTIFDPSTGDASGGGRAPFAGNVIPQSRIDPIARQLLSLYPLPNSGGTGAGGLTNNYRRDEKRTFDRYNYDAKVNWNRTEAHQIWGKFSYLDATVDDRTYFLGPDPNTTGDGGLTKVYQATGAHTWTLSPSMVLDSTFGFSRQTQSMLPPDFAAGNYGLNVLGIPGTNDQGIGDPRYAGYPEFNTGFSALGDYEGWMPAFRDERTYSFAANVTKLMGNHELRGGYLGNYLWLDHWQPEVDNPRGKFDFTTRSTTALLGGASANFYNSFAAFLLGLPGTVSKSVQNEEMTAREWQHGLYFRDRWTASPKLTLDLGLRWEYYPIMHRADRGIERVDLQTLDVLIGGLGGVPENVGLKAGKDNFAPRVGAVYRMNEDTVMRAGYGITYNPLPWARPIRGFYPLTIAGSFFNANTFQPYGTLEQGIPLLTGPDLSSGRVPLPPEVAMRTPEPGNIDRGIIQSWNLFVERRIPWDLSVDIGYVGTKGDGGYADLDVNAPQDIGVGNEGRPYADLGRQNSLLLWGQRLKTRYHALQMSLNRPLTHGLLLKGAYTYSKSMNMADEDGWVGLLWNTPSQYDRNYSLAGFDRTHNFQLGFLYQLPWQTGVGTSSGVTKAIISDWQVNGVFGAFSGTPFTVTANADLLNTPSNQQTADLIGNPTSVGEVGSSGTFYDPSAWTQPTGVAFGNTGRNAFRGPGGINLDLSLFRAFPLGGANRRLEFRLEGFNITNTPKFANPSGDLTSSDFMTITGTLNGYAERNFRLGLRYQF